MNILSLFPLIPLVMMLGLWISKNTRQIHAVMVAGSSALLALAIYLVFHYLGLREAGATDAMLLTDSVVWYAPLNIHYAVGVDGISVAMLLLSSTSSSHSHSCTRSPAWKPNSSALSDAV